MGMNDYIATDPIAIYKAEAAIRDMGKQEYISALLLDGPPGCGKTFLAKYISWQLKAKLMQFQFFPGCGREDLILDLALGPQGQRTQGILLNAMTYSHEKKIVLLLDELDKAEPRVDSFLLTFLNEGSLLVPQLGEFVANRANLIVVITKNDEREAQNPLIRRCRPVQMRWPTPEVEMAIFRQKIPYLTDESCLAIIDTANRLRGHPDVRKAPSTPELLRTIFDIIELVKQGRPIQELGYYYIDCIAPLVRDRQHIPDSPTYLGTRIKRSFDECLTQTDVVIGNKLNVNPLASVADANREEHPEEKQSDGNASIPVDQPEAKPASPPASLPKTSLKVNPLASVAEANRAEHPEENKPKEEKQG